MIEADMVARLNAAATLTAIVGQKIYPVEAPPGTKAPYLVFARVDTDTDDTLDDTASVHHVMFAFEAYAATYKEALAIGAALKPILDGWNGRPPETIMSMTYTGEHDGAGEYDEESRRRRTFCRELFFTALIRA